MMQENMFIDENDVQALKSGYEIDMMIQYSIENPQMSFQEIQSIFEETNKKNVYSLEESFFKSKNGSQVEQDKPQKEILIQNEEIKQIIEVQKMKQKKINVLKNIMNAFSSFLQRFEKKKKKVSKQNKKLMNLKQNQNEIKYFIEDNEVIADQQIQINLDQQEPQPNKVIILPKQPPAFNFLTVLKIKQKNYQMMAELNQNSSQYEKNLIEVDESQRSLYLDQLLIDDSLESKEKQSLSQNTYSETLIKQLNQTNPCFDQADYLKSSNQDIFQDEIKQQIIHNVLNQTEQTIKNMENPHFLNKTEQNLGLPNQFAQQNNFQIPNYQQTTNIQDEGENWPTANSASLNQQTQYNQYQQDQGNQREYVDFQSNNFVNSESFLSSEKTLRLFDPQIPKQLPSRSSIEETIAEIYIKYNNFQKKQDLSVKSCMQNVLSSFKRFMKDKIINKSNLIKLLNQKVYNKLLEYYLLYFSGVWLESCLVQDKIIHQIVIKFLLKCCYSPSLINMFYANKED